MRSERGGGGGNDKSFKLGNEERGSAIKVKEDAWNYTSPIMRIDQEGSMCCCRTNVFTLYNWGQFNSSKSP